MYIHLVFISCVKHLSLAWEISCYLRLEKFLICVPIKCSLPTSYESNYVHMYPRLPLCVAIVEAGRKGRFLDHEFAGFSVGVHLYVCIHLLPVDIRETQASSPSFGSFLVICSLSSSHTD